MKRNLRHLLFASLLMGALPDWAEQNLKMIDKIDFSHVKITDQFWSPRLLKHREATLPVCIDQIENQT
ncbi:MAG: glycoside hydrolase family 127 protein, partial [Bacteroidaceae bacterium]|nr:glycoside hydrolase family 127 protein [Bacteroidaceae bacterium]